MSLILCDLVIYSDDLVIPDKKGGTEQGQSESGAGSVYSQVAPCQRESHSGHRLGEARYQQKGMEFRPNKCVNNVPIHWPNGRTYQASPRSLSPWRHQDVARGSGYRRGRSSQRDATPRGRAWQSPGGSPTGGSWWTRTTQSRGGRPSASRTQNTKVRNGKNCMEKHNAYVETSEDLTVPEEVLTTRTAADQVDLRSMPWFFDNIPKQNALELLQEHGEDRSFIIRESLETCTDNSLCLG